MKIESVLVGGKSRVAPQKPMSIPRLELQAAVLGTRLATSVAERHSIKIDCRWFWSDSKTVLYWLGSGPRKYRQFVGFRLGEVSDSTRLEEWRWIPSKLNVADEATKWQRTPSFCNSNRWFTGPEFLKSQETDWPENIWQNDIVSVEEEEEKPHLAHTTAHSGNIIDYNRFSNWLRLVRTQAYVLRFVHNVRPANKNQKNLELLSSKEILLAENQLYKCRLNHFQRRYCA